MTDRPKKITITYEAPDICSEVDGALIAALGSVGYECGDTGAFLGKGVIARDMEFLPADESEGTGKLYLELWKEEVGMLINLVGMAIEVEQELDNDPGMVHWLQHIKAKLEAASGKDSHE